MSLVGGFPQGYHHHHHHHHHLHGATASGPGPSPEAVYVAASAAAAYYPTSGRYDGATNAADGPYFSTWSYANADSPSEMSPGADYAGTSPLYGAAQTPTDYAGNVIMGAGAGPGLGVTVNGNDPCHSLGGGGGNATKEPYAAPPRFIKRRVTANRKERRRTLSINTAFADLRDCIPNVPSDTKLSKIKTLRLATSYIAYLMDILAKDDPNSIPEGGFKAEVNKKIETREEKKKKEMANLLGTTVIEKKSKGRTGWPQHVWALELKQ